MVNDFAKHLVVVFSKVMVISLNLRPLFIFYALQLISERLSWHMISFASSSTISLLVKIFKKTKNNLRHVHKLFSAYVYKIACENIL
jgi:hypothetical protein